MFLRLENDPPVCRCIFCSKQASFREKIAKKRKLTWQALRGCSESKTLIFEGIFHVFVTGKDVSMWCSFIWLPKPKICVKITKMSKFPWPLLMIAPENPKFELILSFLLSGIDFWLWMVFYLPKKMSIWKLNKFTSQIQNGRQCSFFIFFVSPLLLLLPLCACPMLSL